MICQNLGGGRGPGAIPPPVPTALGRHSVFSLDVIFWKGSLLELLFHGHPQITSFWGILTHLRQLKCDKCRTYIFRAHLNLFYSVTFAMYLIQNCLVVKSQIKLQMYSNKYIKGPSLCKQCLHDLQFMKKGSSSQNLSKLASCQFMKTRSLCRTVYTMNGL